MKRTLALMALIMFMFGCVNVNEGLSPHSPSSGVGVQNISGVNTGDWSKVRAVVSVIEEGMSIRRAVNLSIVSVKKMDGWFLVNVSAAPGLYLKLGVSENGEYVFFNPVSIEELKNITAQLKEQNKVPKADKPKVELFVMSYCPYGLEMEKAIIPVLKLLGDKIDFKLRFVNYAMHPKYGEVQENLRQYCIQKTQPQKLIPYLECFTVNGSYEKDASEECLALAGVNLTSLDKCMEETDQQYNVSALFKNKSTWVQGMFPQFLVDDALNKKYGVRGSPTLVVNGKKVEVDFIPEQIKEKLCEAFNSAPAECNKTLSEQRTTSGFGSSGGSSTGGQCGG